MHWALQITLQHENNIYIQVEQSKSAVSPITSGKHARTNRNQAHAAYCLPATPCHHSQAVWGRAATFYSSRKQLDKFSPKAADQNAVKWRIKQRVIEKHAEETILREGYWLPRQYCCCLKSDAITDNVVSKGPERAKHEQSIGGVLHSFFFFFAPL